MAEGLYITKVDYVGRFGTSETIRLTDDTGSGEIDDVALANAIADASADMDAYLGRRYTLPLAVPHPRLLLAIAGPLVREKLHGTFPTDTVTKEADDARRKLRDLSTGVAVLPTADGTEVEESNAGAETILYSAPARVFTAEKLSRF